MMAIGEGADDILTINQLNIGLARSSKVLQSWLTEKSTPQDDLGFEEDEPIDDPDFRSATETGGLSSKAAYPEDNEMPDGSFQRKQLSSNAALTERIFGQKVANAMKKSQAPGKAMSASKHAAPKPLTTRPKASREVDSDDEDEGRSGAFRSKHQTKGPRPPVEEVDEAEEDINDQVEDVRSTLRQPEDRESALPADSETQEKPTKRKATSYLDEILAQKAKKKSKKKKKDTSQSKA